MFTVAVILYIGFEIGMLGLVFKDSKKKRQKQGDSAYHGATCPRYGKGS